MLKYQSPRSGFTLIEIIVAITILAIIMVALLAAFQTGMKAFDLGSKHGEQQQVGRYAVNTVSKDLRTIFYKPENEYNVARRQVESLSEQNQEVTGRSDKDSEKTSKDSLDIDQNLPDVGPAIDLKFKGDDGGDTDHLSFVVRLGYKEGQEQVRWNLARVDYYVEDGMLYRSIDDITAPEVDEDGNEIPKLTPPQVDKIASNCVGFDVQYGYYYDKAYHLAESWDSSASQYRNPETDEDEEAGIIDPLKNPEKAGVVSSGAAAAAVTSANQQNQMQTQDNLPGWVKVTFRFAPDMKSPERYRTYQQTILLYNRSAVETYVPTDDEDGVLVGKRGKKNSRSQTKLSGGSSTRSGAGVSE